MAQNPRFQPDPIHTFNHNPAYSLNQRRLAALVGLTALGLPITQIVGTWFGTCFYDSVSHFYYAQFLGGLLVAALAFIATFMIAYRGENKIESKLATAAGLCLLVAALFPTADRGCELAAFSGRAFADFSLAPGAEFVTIADASADNPYFELFPLATILHFAGAAVFFLFLVYYTFCIFTRIIPEEHYSEDGTLKPAKALRNRFYRASGSVIVMSLAVIFLKFLYETFTGTDIRWWDEYNILFWLETAALWAFGWSWMVKGRFFDLFCLDDRERLVRSP